MAYDKLIEIGAFIGIIWFIWEIIKKKVFKRK